MKKLIEICLAILILTSCSSVKTDDYANDNMNQTTEQTENVQDDDEEQAENIRDDAEAAPPEFITLWQRTDGLPSCNALSWNVYSIGDEMYSVSSASLEPVTATVKSLALSGETVEITAFEDVNGNLKCLKFNGANRDTIYFKDNKAIIVDYYAHQLFEYDLAANTASPLLSDSAYGFEYADYYETLTGKYEVIDWLLVPAINDNADKIVYWSDKYADNGVMSLTPGIWILDLKNSSEYRLELGDLVPTVHLLDWIDNETLMFSTYSDEFYKLNVNTNKLEVLNLPYGDTFISVSNGYAVYKTDNAVCVNDLTKNTVTEYAVTEPVIINRVFERNGIIALESKGSVFIIENESKSINTYEIGLEENQAAGLNGWSEDALVIEVVDITTNEIDKICVIPTEGLKR